MRAWKKGDRDDTRKEERTAREREGQDHSRELKRIMYDDDDKMVTTAWTGPQMGFLFADETSCIFLWEICKLVCGLQAVGKEFGKSTLSVSLHQEFC